MDFCNKLNIVFLSHYSWPHVGGVEKHVAKITKALTMRGHLVTIISARNNYVDKNIDVTKNVRVVGIKLLPVKFIGLLWIWFQLFKIRGIFLTADIIHIHDVALWYLPLRVLYPQKKIFLTVHDWEGKYPIPLKNILIKQFSTKIVESNICIGRYLEKYYKIKANKIIYGAVDRSSTIKAKKEKELIVYVGRLASDTGLNIFLSALRKKKRSKVIFCGDGPLLANCKYYGEVKHLADPTKYMARATVVIASGYLTIIESLANRSLVIAAYDNPIRRDILKMTPFRSLIHIVHSPSQLNKVLDLQFKHLNRYEQAITKGGKWATSQSWEKVVNVYMDLWCGK